MKIGGIARCFPGIVIFLLCIGVAHAQITLDGSMGVAGTLTGPNFVIPSTVGQIRGSNLFHSFGLFNVLTGQSATFTGPNSISNIFGRVTGGQSSTIDGTIRSTIPNSNLYMMNPAGMLFGPNAWLDVQGSFHATTADYLKFSDGAKFHADLTRQSTLTTAAVSAFGFLSQNPAGMDVFGSILQVPEQKTLSLSGGDVQIVGGVLSAPSGTLSIASVGSPGEVPLNVQDMTLTDFARLGKINLSAAILDTSGDGGGTVVIRGGRLMIDQSLVFSETLGDIDGAAIGADIKVQGDLSLTGGSVIDSSTFGAGRGGNVILSASESAQILNSAISSATAGTGAGGIVTIFTPTLNVDGGFIFSSSTSQGNAGQVILQVGHLSFLNGGAVDSSALSTGKGGEVIINASEAVLMSGFRLTPTGPLYSGINTSTAAEGAAGLIMISAPNLTVDGGAILSSSAPVFLPNFPTPLNPTGDAGSIVLNVGRLFLSNGGIIDSSSGSLGQGGNIAVTAQQINLENSSSISARSFGVGNAGNITLTASNAVTLNNSAISTEAATSDGGNINLNVGKLVYLFNSQITSAVGNGPGTGGKIMIDPQAVVLNHSKIKADASEGPGGSVTIVSDIFLASSDSSVTASSALSTPGTVDIQAPIIDLSGSLAQLPENVLNAPALMRQSCAARFSGGKLSSLAVGSRAGLPLEPGGYLSSPIYWQQAEVVPSVTRNWDKHWGQQFAGTLLSLDSNILRWGCSK